MVADGLWLVTGGCCMGLVLVGVCLVWIGLTWHEPFERDYTK